MEEKKQLIGNLPAPAEEKKDDPVQIARQILFFQHVHMCATQRKARNEDLMSRRIAKTWDAKKKAKMVRRLMTASEQLEQSTSALEQLNHRLSQVTTAALDLNMPKLASAPFVPPPPTSV